jgi:hypothetical protein
MKIERLLRYMAWEEVKGKLQGILETYDVDDKEAFEELDETINSFVKKIEDTGLLDS